MNREIKFKILKLDINFFLYNEGRTILEIGAEDLEAIKHNTDNYKFIQYTGLKDKNGKEIYDGDIVRQTINASRKEYEVGFKNGCFRMGTFAMGVGWEDGKDIEVIGNIYQNKELII